MTIAIPPIGTPTYLTGRRKYQRPQAIMFADNPGTLIDGYYVPQGYEVGTTKLDTTDSTLVDSFLILSDDNRSPLQFAPIRIETRQRMVNGRMRSYHIADKTTISTSWNMLPSRAFYDSPNFDFDSGKADISLLNRSLDHQYTTDGGAGGVEILNWYENHKGSFWVYLSYDKYDNFQDELDGNGNPTKTKYRNLDKYSQVIEVFFSSFDYSVQKRGGSNYDFWNISLTLEEV